MTGKCGTSAQQDRYHLPFRVRCVDQRKSQQSPSYRANGGVHSIPQRIEPGDLVRKEFGNRAQTGCTHHPGIGQDGQAMQMFRRCHPAKPDGKSRREDAQIDAPTGKQTDTGRHAQDLHDAHLCLFPCNSIKDRPLDMNDNTTGDDEERPVPIPAATLVIFRHRLAGPPELLVVERSANMAFAGGAIVFPGGRIDADDHAIAAAHAHERDEGAARGGSVEVRAGQFSARPGALDYNVVLMRDGSPRKALSGVVQLTVSGESARGAPTTLALEPIALSMLGHEVVRGSAPLPEGFKPRQTTVQVLDKAAGKSLGMRVLLVR